MTGCGIFSDDLGIYVSLRLPKTCAVFQAKVYLINVAAKEISQFLLVFGLLIYIDNLAAIKTLNRIELNHQVKLIFDKGQRRGR